LLPAFSVSPAPCCAFHTGNLALALLFPSLGLCDHARHRIAGGSRHGAWTRLDRSAGRFNRSSSARRVALTVAGMISLRIPRVPADEQHHSPHRGFPPASGRPRATAGPISGNRLKGGAARRAR
jgi:hypothetical protein